MFLIELLGLKSESSSNNVEINIEPFEKAVDLLLKMRLDAKNNKDWATSDLIRNELSKLGFEIKDTKRKK